ncbi:hypothetical protein [Flavobacterium sp.]|uniref:hypothetical protein n=1 Tax=Flavobacterium sp. TaxID=239 RepID=UPI00286EB26D|nr:hypothetical protein [Flavobacterium sp.]
MNDYLKKINLAQEINIELQISKLDFTKKFRENVDESNLGFEPFEVFTSSKNEYKGYIENNGFELKKRQKLFDTSYSFAKASGTFVQETDKLTIKTFICGFQKKMFVFFGFLIFFYAIFLSGIFFADDNAPKFIIVPFLLFHATLMFGIPYFIMRRSVKRMVYDLERDFHYWVTKN